MKNPFIQSEKTGVWEGIWDKCSTFAVNYSSFEKVAENFEKSIILIIYQLSPMTAFWAPFYLIDNFDLHQNSSNVNILPYIFKQNFESKLDVLNMTNFMF